MIGRAAYEGSTNAERAEHARQSRPRREFSRGPLARGLSIVILNLNRPDLIAPLSRRLMRSRAAFEERGFALQVIVGDTGSTDPETLAAYQSIEAEAGAFFEVVRELRYHFSENNNAVAFSRARTDALLFLNNDVIPPPDREPFLEMREALDRGADLAGAFLWFPDGSLQHAGVGFMPAGDRKGLPFHRLAGDRVSDRALAGLTPTAAVTGACLAIRAALFQRIGGFDEAYAREAQDIDLCLCAHRLGARIDLLNVGRVVHIENGTRPKGDLDPADRSLFLRRWSSYVEAFDL